MAAFKEIKLEMKKNAPIKYKLLGASDWTLELAPTPSDI
jgi:hypothetical protein